MNSTIAQALKETYRVFGYDVLYGGVSVKVMRDIYVLTEHEKQKALKIKTSDVATSLDASGNIQLVTNEIDSKRIISWEYSGNEREEIILIIESDGRGN